MRYLNLANPGARSMLHRIVHTVLLIACIELFAYALVSGVVLALWLF
jgi:hypothetical protein